MTECDGEIVAAAYAFENELLTALKSCLKKETYVVGPLLPSSYGAPAQSSRGADDIQAFLDEKVTSHGENSVLLVRLSNFFPASRSQLEFSRYLLEALSGRRHRNFWKKLLRL